MNTNTPSARQTWWNYLEPQWQQAFNEAVLNKRGIPTNIPTDEELQQILTTPTLRLAGPKAPFPNLSIEVDNCSGISELKNLEILVITFCKLSSIKEVAGLKKLNSLFLNNNQITSLEGIEQLTSLTDLYCNVNQIDSIAAIKNLTNLKTFYCNYNLIDSLEGIQPKHTSKLKGFFCLPNENLPDKEIIRVENRIGIRCQRG